MSGITFGSQVIDAYRITGPARVKGPTDFINVARDPAPIIQIHFNGMSADEMIRGGRSLSEFPITSTGDTTQETIPGQDRSWSRPNVLEELTENFRMVEDALVWNQIVRDLNSGTGSGGMSYERIKSEQAREEIRVSTAFSNKLNAQFFAEPNLSTMTGTTATSLSPTSLFVGINEYGGPTTVSGAIADATDPRFPAGAGLPNGWTTIHGVNPSTSRWHRCWQIPYSDVGPTVSTESPQAHNLLQAFYKAIECVKAGPVLRNLGANAGVAQSAPYNSDYYFACSRNGMALIRTLMQVGQGSHFRMDPQDPWYPNPTLAGIPFIHASGMDSAAVYPTSGTTAPALGSGVREDSASAAFRGPRYALVNKRDGYRQFVHNIYNFYMWPAQVPDRQHDNVVIPVTMLHQRMFLERKRCAFIYPVANITGFGG